MQNKKGIISVTAMGIFALLIVFLLLIQGVITETYRNIRTQQNKQTASDIADSIFQYLELQINQNSASFNSGQVTCQYNGNQPEAEVDCQPIQDPTFQENLIALADNNNLQLSFEIKGHHNQNETLATNNNRFDEGYYTVPQPGSGSAGTTEICNLYQPSFNQSHLVDESLITPLEGIDQLEYACNWNRLTLGSSTTDRVSIPLFYQDQNGEIVEPFFGDDGANQKLYVRFRTPCNCAPDQHGNVPIGCSTKDPNVCTPQARYTLPGFNQDRGNEIIAQWQISSPNCGNGDECTIVGYDDEDQRFETVINNSQVNNYNENQDQTIIEGKSSALNLNNNEAQIILKRGFTPGTLSFMEKPILSIAINNKLLSNNIERIPHLEYQLLTTTPISYNKIPLQISVTVNKNNYRQTKLIAKPTSTIDFAIQN